MKVWEELSNLDLVLRISSCNGIWGSKTDDSGQMVGIKAVWRVCGKCDECNAGEDALCSNALSSGAHKNGTFQEYAIGPASYVTPVPEGIDPLISAPLMVHLSQ